jgi:hypothetical protein
MKSKGKIEIFETIPKPEDIALKLSISAWLTAPISGALAK